MNLKITDLIYKKNNFLKKESCDYFINIFEKYKNLLEKERSTKYIKNKKHEIEEDNYESLHLNFNANNNDEIKTALFKAWECITPIIQEYVDYLKANISSEISIDFINSTSNIRILKYSEGHLIKDHLDVDAYVRASCTINLNENYTGGEFIFFSGKHVETFKTGDIMIFPAEPIWIHGTRPIEKGTRYAINCFLHSQDKK
jgi:hypothetical protein